MISFSLFVLFVMSYRGNVSSSIKKEGPDGCWTIQFNQPIPTIPSITITLDAKVETDIPHVGEQLWVGSLLLAEYLLSQ